GRPGARPLHPSRTLWRTRGGKHRMGPPSRNDEAHERNARETKLVPCVDGQEIGSRRVGNAISREGENRGAARFSCPQVRTIVHVRKQSEGIERRGNSMKRYSTSCALSLLLTIVFATIAFAQITPSDDSYTLTSSPTANFGAATTLNVQSAGATTFVRFDLSGIPPTVTGAMVAKATLKIYVGTVTTAGSFNVDLVTSSWKENTITANDSPTLGSAIASAVPVIAADKNKYVLIDVTTAAVDWLNGTANDGLAIVPDGAVSFALNSKETTTTSHPAELDIVLTGPAGPPGPISGVTAGAGLTGGGTKGNVKLSLLTTCTSGQVLQWNGSTWVCATSKGTGTITGVSAGTLGVGTTAPAAKLDVSFGDAVVRGVGNYQQTGQVANLFVGDTNTGIQAVFGSGLAFNTYLAPNAMFINQADGHVGIGWGVTDLVEYQLFVLASGGGPSVNGIVAAAARRFDAQFLS